MAVVGRGVATKGKIGIAIGGILETDEFEVTVRNLIGES